jgi:hypothetical protein
MAGKATLRSRLQRLAKSGGLDNEERLRRIVQTIDLPSPPALPLLEPPPLRPAARGSATGESAAAGPAPRVAGGESALAPAAPVQRAWLASEAAPATEPDPLRYLSAIIEGWGDLMLVVKAVTVLRDHKALQRRHADAAPLIFFSGSLEPASTADADADADAVRANPLQSMAGMTMRAKRALRLARERLRQRRIATMQAYQQAASAAAAAAAAAAAGSGEGSAAMMGAASVVRSANALAAEASRQRAAHLGQTVSDARAPLCAYFADLDASVGSRNPDWAANPIRHLLLPPTVQQIVDTHRRQSQVPLPPLNMADMLRQAWQAYLNAGIALTAYIGWRDLLAEAYMPLIPPLAACVQLLERVWLEGASKPTTVRAMSEGLVGRGVPRSFATQFVASIVDTLAHAATTTNPTSEPTTP